MAHNDPGPLALIVEDNPANLMLARAILERSGFRIEEARSAEEARDRLQAIRPDVILMDIQLPGEDGLSLTREIKAGAFTVAIPIIAVTAHAMKEDEALILAAGCDGYVTKPIDTRMLAAQVRAIMDSARQAGGLTHG